MIVIKGSILDLNVESIVNAANPSGLGCFTPGHQCIDNIIHRNAGPKLHDECKLKMAIHKGPLRSKPIVTNGYNLRAKYVMHVAGPYIEPGSTITIEKQQLLSDCYTNCLKEAIKMNIKSLAFPCISTGLYNFDNKLAAKLAIDAVKKFNNRDILVVFCVFKDIDEQIYCDLLKM